MTRLSFLVRLEALASHEGDGVRKENPIQTKKQLDVDSKDSRNDRPMVSHFLSAFWTGKTIGEAVTLGVNPRG